MTRPDPYARAHTTVAELRELTRDAHAAIKDLRQLLRDARSEMAGQLEARFQDQLDHWAAAQAAELGRARDQIQAELDTVSAQLRAFTGTTPDQLGQQIVDYAGRQLVAQLGPYMQGQLDELQKIVRAGAGR